MKKCIVISDSFKGTLSSIEISNLAKQSILRILPDCEVISIPVADGGEGTVECFVQAIGAVPVEVAATGPYGEPIHAVYARCGSQAIVEMACAAGLPMVGERLNPELTTTFGVGSVIRHAVEHGCTEILLGLGGSATNDGGCGCAAALGVVFYDNENHSFIPTGETLNRIARIDRTQADQLLKDVKITVMCDVENPLCGPNGASYTFAPQKGADIKMVQRLDSGLAHLAKVIEQDLGILIKTMAGAGAAGGMGGGCVAFLQAQLSSGIEAVLNLVNFDQCLSGTDLVITGEGRIDSQSIQGKVISGIAKHTREKNIPLVAIVGSIDPSAVKAYDVGVTALFGIDREAKAFSEYAHQSAQNYQHTLEDILRLLKAMER